MPAIRSDGVSGEQHRDAGAAAVDAPQHGRGGFGVTSPVAILNPRFVQAAALEVAQDRLERLSKNRIHRHMVPSGQLRRTSGFAACRTKGLARLNGGCEQETYQLVLAFRLFRPPIRASVCTVLDDLVLRHFERDAERICILSPICFRLFTHGYLDSVLQGVQGCKA